MAGDLCDLLERANALLASSPVVDGHNDLAWAIRELAGYDLDEVDVAVAQPRLQTDIPRLRAGGVGAQFWSVYVPSKLQGDHAVSATLEQIDAVRAMVARYPDDLALARTADEVERAVASGRIASLLGAEGGHSIDASLGTLGMLVELGHLAETTMRAAVDASRAPVIFSHSSALALCDVPRNIPDEVLGRLAGNGGICMVTFVPMFVSPRFAEWWALAREHVAAQGLDPG